jgi:hypothetical protein
MGNEREKHGARRALTWPFVAGAVACAFDVCSCSSSSSSESPDGSSQTEAAAPETDAAAPTEAGTPETDGATPENEAAAPDATPQEAGTGSAPDAMSPETSTSFPTTPNLILNPGAELGPGTDGTVPPTSVPDWNTTGEANVVLYGSSGGFPGVSDAGPPTEGMNFFGGGPNDTVSTFTQTISLASYTADIAQGHVSFTVSGWLGGFSSQDDNAVLTLYWLDAADASVVGAAGDAGAVSADGGDASLPPGALASATIGPVTPSQRSEATGFVLQTTTGTVPSGTVAVEVQLVMTRYDGTNNDGFADDLSLTLTGN